MIKLFIITLLLTFFIIRLLAYLLHDSEYYGTCFERSKTPTGMLRKKTGYDWHHFHIGILLLLLIAPLIYLKGFDNLNLVVLSISISLVIDQIVLIFGKNSNYFNKKDFYISLSLHLFLSSAILLFKFF